jgi:hypothetical protein
VHLDNFSFPGTAAKVVADGAPAPGSDLGPVALFLNDGDQSATWAGTGFNAIWRPFFDPVNAPQQHHFLELNFIDETLTFERIPGKIFNRGLLQKDIAMFGVSYIDKINDANVIDPTTGKLEGLHFEPGIWAIVPPTSAPQEPQTVVRMASIPHGTVINAQGTVDPQPVPGGPDFPVASLTPTNLNTTIPFQPPFPEQTLTTASSFRTAATDVPGIDQKIINDPNTVLENKLAGVTVHRTTTFSIATSNQPVPGGGIANTAFLEDAGSAASPGNAQAVSTKAFFWVMDVTTADGVDQRWLQYSQSVILNFGPISWPHVTVGTLVRQ